MRNFLRAEAYTVLKSPRKTRFPLRILSQIPAFGNGQVDLLLGRVSGEAIRMVGGVPAGASGSPVFVGKRLVGAISHIIGGDPFLVGITPLNSMLALKAEPALPRADAVKTLENTRANRVLAAGSGFKSAETQTAIRKHYCGIPLFSVDESSPIGRPNPSPGDPVGVALMVGALSLGFVGTVTYVRDRQLYAFGHPLLFSGSCQYPLTRALILTTARGAFPNKIGVIGEVIGTVIQDRASGIYGLLGQMPQGLVGGSFEVIDDDRKVTVKHQVRMIHIPAELPFLAYIAILETITQAMNRIGEGTARWEWKIGVLEDKDAMVMVDEQYDAFNIGSAVADSVSASLAELLSAGRQLTEVKLTARVTRSAAFPP